MTAAADGHLPGCAAEVDGAGEVHGSACGGVSVDIEVGVDEHRDGSRNCAELGADGIDVDVAGAVDSQALRSQLLGNGRDGGVAEGVAAGDEDAACVQRGAAGVRAARNPPNAAAV